MIATAKAVARAVEVYGTPAMKEMVKNCMDQDFSWKVSDSFFFCLVCCKFALMET